MTNSTGQAPLAQRLHKAWGVILGTSADPKATCASASEKSADPGNHEQPIKLAQRTYEEVLDATKHQDDKVGRFLTAIAFLTTGAITLIASNGALSRQFEVPGGREHPLLAWSTGGFFTLTLAAVALLLLCLSVPIRLPKTAEDPMKSSHLFYSYIATRPRDEWSNHWSETSDKTLEESIAKDYYREAHNLAERTSAKYRHSYEASWLFVCALLFLGVSVYLRVITEFEDVGVASTLIDSHLYGLAAIASLHASLQIYTRWVHDVRSMERARDYDRKKKGLLPEPIEDPAKRGTKDDPRHVFDRNVANYRQRRWTLSLIVSATVFSVALALPVDDIRHGRTVALAVIGLATFIPTWLTRQVWDTKEDTAFTRKSPGSWWLPVLVTAGSIGTAGAALCADGVWRVVAIILPPLVTGVVNLSRPAHSSLLARRLQRDRSQSEVSKEPPVPAA